VTRCLRKDPEERWSDAAELGAALGALVEHLRSTSSPGPPAADPDPVSLEIRAALDRGAWREAYESLRALADRRPLSADELEVLAEMTVWVGRYEETIAALEKAYAAHSDSGRNRSAARVALTLAAGFVEMKKPAVSRGWQRRAESLLRNDPECLEAGLLLRRQTVDALGAGDWERAFELNRKCAAIAATTGDRDLQVVALHDRGQILVARGDVEEGTAIVDEAMAAAVSGDVGPMTLGNLFCRTLTVCRAVADFERAREWSELAGRWSGANESTGFTGICRIHSAETMRHHGRWDEADRTVRSACEVFERVGPPSHAGEAFNELGELALWRGEYEEAEAAFRRAHEYGHDPVPGLPMLRLAQGKGPVARKMIERALAESPPDRLRRASLLSAHVEIALALGELPAAEGSVAELATSVEDLPCPALRARLGLARGALALARGEAAAATGTLREAWSTFHEAGLVYDAARARVVLARAYLATGDEEDARLQLDAARRTFADLGAQPDRREVDALIEEADRAS
jgi:tetratricopeptide (TPR) repeat protein